MTLAKFAMIAGRVLAALCLYVGLFMAAGLLGVHSGGQSPLLQLGPTAFTYLAIFTLGYLFAAVGIWIGSTWGYVVAVGTALAELVLAMLGDPAVKLSTVDFFAALIVLIVGAALFVLVEIRPFSSFHD